MHYIFNKIDMKCYIKNVLVNNYINVKNELNDLFMGLY